VEWRLRRHKLVVLLDFAELGREGVLVCLHWYSSFWGSRRGKRREPVLFPEASIGLLDCYQRLLNHDAGRTARAACQETAQECRRRL